MLPFRMCLFSLLIAACAVSGGKIVFEESASSDAQQQPANTESNSNVGTRNGPFSDSITVEAAGTPASGEPDGRLFGLFSGGSGGLLGGLVGGGFHGGYPGGPGAGIGASKPGRCPGILGLGIGQPEGGYGYGHQGFYGGYGHQHGHNAFGGAPFGGHGFYPGAGNYFGLGGHNGGFGFRSADQSNDGNAEKGERRRRSDDTTEAKKDSTDGESAAQGRALANDHQTDPRLLGIFGQSCYYDYHCPGQLKCCAGILGKHATCQQPALFG